MFILQNAPQALRASGTDHAFLDFDPEIARFDLTLELAEAGEQPDRLFRIQHRSVRAATTIARLAAHFRVLLEGSLPIPKQRISRFPLLPMSERRSLLTGWNGRRADFTARGSFSLNASTARREDAGTQRRFPSGRRGSELSGSRPPQFGGCLPARARGRRAPRVVVAVLAERGSDLLVGNDRGAARGRRIPLSGAQRCLRPGSPKLSSPAARRYCWSGRAARQCWTRCSRNCCPRAVRGC